MNVFQKQLMIGNKSLAELPNLDGYVWKNKIIPPVKVSVEEFLGLLMTPEEPEDTYGSDDDESSSGQDENTNSDDWNNDYDEDEARYGDDRDD